MFEVQAGGRDFNHGEVVINDFVVSGASYCQLLCSELGFLSGLFLQDSVLEGPSFEDEDHLLMTA